MSRLLKSFLKENTKLEKKTSESNDYFELMINFFDITSSMILDDETMILLLDNEMRVRNIFFDGQKGLNTFKNRVLNLENNIIEDNVFIRIYQDTSIYCYISKQFIEEYYNCRYRFAIISLKADNKKYRKMIDKLNCSILKLLKYNNEKYSFTENLLMYLDSIDDGISACDSDGIVRYINKSACNMIGAKKEDIINKELEAISSSAILSQVIRNGKTYMDFEYFLDYRNKTFHLMNSAYPVYDGNKKIVGAIDIFRRIKRSMKLASELAGYEAIYKFENFIGSSKVFQESIELAKRFAESDKNILILGESGTGKELFAQAIHNYSKRRNGPFVAINCANFPKDLFDSELFGYDEGAFTGARKGGKVGKFELASGGTLFLDEIGEMPIHLQAKLLRVLEDKSITRIGSNKKIDVNVRIIAATNRNLEDMVKSNNFRRDLYYRLKVLYLKLPPLKERENDVIELSNYFIDRFSKEDYRNIKGIDKEAKKLLLSYDWPGNIRELENIIELSLFMCDGEYINREQLLRAGLQCQDDTFSEKINTPKKLSDINKELILKTLEETKGNKRKAAEILGISRNTIYRTLKRYD
ncbi:sigma 54-interacting transcriptional regulator [Wukongibacter baidiensis]|uniref:sigma-54 interaction domain-containing protein n=1 Tax=Wukongibacter baidiensis TaxID=1723361 RepID=UPI003D7FC158